MLQIAIVTNILAHYRLPCFNHLSQVIKNQINKNQVTFFFLAHKMTHRSYVLSQNPVSFQTIYLKGLDWHRPPDDDKHLNNIIPIIKNCYDVILIGGWDEPTYLLLWLLGIIMGRKVLFWIESTTHENPRYGIKEYYKRLLFRYAAGCIVPGKRSYEYCSMLGMAKDKIFIAPNAADRKYFRSQAERYSSLKYEIRNELGLPAVTLLFVGRLVEKHKNVSVLINAFSNLLQNNNRINLLIVGDGPDRKKYENLLKERGIDGVHFLGELNHDQLSRVYTASNILILPSKWEPWGFVLNEGMEFGLPLVVSDAVGAGPDLVHHGENGFIFPVGNVTELTTKLEMLIKDEPLRNRMGEKSKQIIEYFSPEHWTEGVVRAINTISEKNGLP